MARKGNPEGIEDADVEIGASVEAKRLRFREKPKTQVELHGELDEPEGHTDFETASGSERQNLPDEVEPGVTYRDVRVRWGATARLGKRGSSEDAEGPEQGRKSDAQGGQR